MAAARRAKAAARGAADALAQIRRPRLAAAPIIGHARQARGLLEALESGRVAHAWLFAGERSLGKASLAYAFARALLAGGSGAKGGEPSRLPFADGQAAAKDADAEAARALWARGDDEDLRRRVGEGTEPRCVILDPAEMALVEGGRASLQIRVDDIRRIQQFLALRAAPGERRVIVIDDADRMTLAAANALLKMLEEPPADVVFLVVAHRLHRLPATIRSRCRLVNFHPLPSQVVAAWLAEDIGAEEEAAQTAAALAGGVPGRALKILESDLTAHYRAWLAALKDPARDPAAFERRAEAVGRIAALDPSERGLLLDLIQELPARLLRALADAGEGRTLLAEERALAERFRDRDREALFAFRDFLAARIDGAERLYLDLKAVLWTVLARFDALLA